MKRILIPALFIFFFLTGFNANAQEIAAKVSNDASTSAEAGAAIDTFGYDKLTIEVDMSSTPTATVDTQCKIGSNGDWVNLTGGTVSATGSDVSTLVTIAHTACAQVRTNISAYTAGTISTRVQWWSSQ